LSGLTLESKGLVAAMNHLRNCSTAMAPWFSILSLHREIDTLEQQKIAPQVE
jgi:hypothetical protein